MLGIIKSIEEVQDFTLSPMSPLQGRGGRLGMSQIVNVLSGRSDMDGYKVETDEHVFYVLIDNDQSCCENWGYMISEDDESAFVGAKLLSVDLTDVALNKERLETSGFFGSDEGGIQFVDFVTTNGTLQLAVYNEHNGYYGHGILVVKDDEILLNETL